MPGAKLCTPCKAAIKRSRDASVWELPNLALQSPQAIGAPSIAGLPPVRIRTPVATVRTRVARPAIAGPVVRPIGSKPRASGAWVVAICIVLGVATVLALLRHERRESQSAATVPYVSLFPASDETRTSPSTLLQGSSSEADRGEADARELHGNTVAAPLLRPRQPNRHASVAPVAPEAAPPDPVPAPKPAPTAMANAPVVPMPLAAPAAPRTRWDAMSDSLAHCSGGLLDRVACEQRTRLEYCDGYWGSVPQCPSGIANDHGQ